MMTIFEGLKLIDSLRLPHPEWEFVKTSKDLKKFFKIKDYVGWTIRTVKVLGQKNFKNLYINWLAKDKVPEIIDKFQKQFKGKAVFIIYPSWRWHRGGTLFVDKKRIIIETIRGPVEKLVREGKIDCQYIYNYKLQLIEFLGPKIFLRPAEKKIILAAISKIKKFGIGKGFILEWGITTQNKFIFYKIEKIQEAAKRLLKKYL